MTTKLQSSAEVFLGFEAMLIDFRKGKRLFAKRIIWKEGQFIRMDVRNNIIQYCDSKGNVTNWNPSLEDIITEDWYTPAY